MDDPHFDHRSAKRFDRQRASGPFGVDEVLPKKISTWVNRKHPDSGKRQVLLNFAEWQRGQAARILADFELHVYEWTLTTVKHRQSLDKQDKRDIAQSVFAQDRDGRLAAYIAAMRATTIEREDDDQQTADQAAEYAVAFRLALIDNLIDDEENDVEEKDRTLLQTGLEMTLTEFDLLQTLVRVFDHARSHFVYEICEPSTRRFLNAHRIRYEETAERMPWAEYKLTLLSRMQNSSTIDGLISFILKPRENGCPIGLWVAERIAERRLLNEDGIEMSEDTWLELVLAFLTNEEKQTLQVPARDQRAGFDGGNGYDVLSLQRSLVRFDPNTFRRFQQAQCHDPVAERVVAIFKLQASDRNAAKGDKKRGELELHANTKEDGRPHLQKPANSRGEKLIALPTKDGKPDQGLYDTFPAKSLRRRLWDAITEKKCPRCNGPHLRVACLKPRQGWEDDFEKADFFTKPPPPKPQVRVQLERGRNLQATGVLTVICPTGLCLVDTCSDVSLARHDVLTNVRAVAEPVAVGHLGGETQLGRAGSFRLGRTDGAEGTVLHDVFSIDPELLPAGVVALIGVGDVRRLGISLDTVLAFPDRPWEQAIQVGVFARLARRFRSLFARARPPTREPEARSYLDHETVPLMPHGPRHLERELAVAQRPAPRNKEAERENGANLLAATKDRLAEEQRMRGAARVAELVQESIVRKMAIRAVAAAQRNSHQSSCVNTPSPQRYGGPVWPRKRPRFYAVRRGRATGIFHSWEECERQTKGIASEFKSFSSREEAEQYLHAFRRTNYMAFRKAKKPGSSFFGGQALRAQIDVWQDGHADSLRTECGLDTMSDVNLALIELLHDVREVSMDEVRTGAGKSEFTKEGTLKVLQNGEVVSIPALVATARQLPRSCEVLLGVPGLDRLGVCIDDHRTKQRQPLICFVGEKTLRTWWDANEGLAAPPINEDVEQIDVCPDLPASIQARVRQLLRKHEGVFEGKQVTMPKPFSAEPVELKFVEDPKPQSIPEPRWTHAQKLILTQWAQAGLKDGSLELSTSRWASRPHIVMKTPASSHKDLVDISKCKLRVCGDYRAANTQIVKIVPNLPSGLEEVEKAAGYAYYWESDSVACYSQFVLAAGRSREALAIWTPIGLVQPTTLPFGQKNSGTEAQGPYRAAASEMQRGRHGNYVDDWIGYSDDLDQLIEDFQRFLEVCEKYCITLGISKTRFGYAEAQFFGFRVNKQGSHLALKHLDPIRNLVPPTDIHELRRVLGLFVVSRRYIRDYALVSQPMTAILRGKLPVFRWGPEQQRAFDEIRDKLLQGVHLAAPDFDLPFHLATDASEDGKGGELYQLPSIPVPDQYPYDPKLHAPENHAVIFFLSKAFDETQRLRPPFYLEGDSLLWCTKKSRYYALSSRFPLYTYSDHMPLKWMEKTEKGPISSFILEHLSEIETVHQYIQGKVNTLPDACSRYPMLGPKRLATRGLANSVAEMLRRLPARLKEATTVHYHGGKQGAELRESLKDWFAHVGALQSIAPPTKEAPTFADFAVFIPRSEVSPIVLARYLLSPMPFAVLVPVDLLALASAPNIFRQAPHADIAARFAKAGKITILATQMTWVLGNLDDCAPVEMFAASLRTPAPVTGFGHAAQPNPNGDGSTRAILSPADLDEIEGTVPRTLESWVRAQKTDDQFDDLLKRVEDKALQNELWLHAAPGRVPTIIVPTAYQEPLIRDTHARMFHLHHAKVFALLKQSYFWPGFRAQTRAVLEDCPECELTKARQQTAHALFHATPIYAPRSRWCMDFQGQGTALTGETEALALIDPTSRYVVLIPLKDRQASTWLQPFLDRIIFTFGAPEQLHSDDAPEFVSEAMDLLAQATDIKTTTTLGHNARGNGTIEVWWRFWNRCMRLLSDDHYAQWPSFASRIAFAYNAAGHEAIASVSPFEVYHGAPARNPYVSSLTAPLTLEEGEELALPAQFAQAVALSTSVFTQLAKTHDSYVRRETAARLNEKGHSTSFQIGDKVKIRVPPTQAQLLLTGRKAKHVTAWRGPCTILERLSTTAYAVIDDTSKRRYERVVSNLSRYRAEKAKVSSSAQFNQRYSSQFAVDEFIAIRDEPSGPFYLARVLFVTSSSITVHYYGCTQVVLAAAIFKPCWHEVGGDEMILALDCPEDDHPRHFVDYNGTIALKDIESILVARNLELTKGNKLRFRSLHALAPVHDQLFRFEN